MAMGSDVTLVFDSKALPLLPGAVRLAEKGILTGGCRRNRAYLADKVLVNRSVRAGLVEVAFDPQTSGGLLLALSAGDAPRLVDALQAGGVEAAVILGRATARQEAWVRLI
jgi:selenide,water dikinase